MTTQMPPKRARSDDRYGTPAEAVDLITPHLKANWLVWEPACGEGSIVAHLQSKGFRVFGTDKEHDFLLGPVLECDCIVTNPPYSLKNHFIRRCYEIAKPFALLMPITALESEERQQYYRKYGLQLIIPNKRIDFTLPDGSRKTHGSWFGCAWYTNWLSLPEQINFRR